MFCPNCGAENQDDAIFCESCGADIAKQFSEAKKLQGEEQRSQYSPAAKQQVQMTPYVYSRSPAALGKPLKKSTKVVAAVAAAVIVLAVVLYNAGLKVCSPQTAAKNFFEAASASDWDKAYSYMSVPENEFVNKSNFIKKAKSSKIPKIVNYSIKDTDTSSVLASTDTSDKSKSGLSETVTVEFTTQDDATPQQLQLNLIKQKDKKFFFFDDWKVVPADFVTSGVIFSVPDGCSVSLDGTKLADKYISKAAAGDDGSTAEDSSFVTYTLPSVFSGSYALKISSPYTDDYKSDININSSSSSFGVEADMLKVKQSVKDKVKEMPKQALNDIYAAAFAGKDFDSVKSYFTADEDTQSYAASLYSDMLSHVYSENNDGFKNITFTNITAEEENSQNGSGGMSMVLGVRADYSYTYTYQPYFGDGGTQDYTGTNSRYMSFTYRLCDGKWLISNCDGLAIYY